jgi:hypothetical protein
MDSENGFFVRAAHVFDRSGRLYIQRYFRKRTYIYQFTMMINKRGNEKILDTLRLIYGGVFYKSRWRLVENQAKMFLTDIRSHSKRKDIELAMEYFRLREERCFNRFRISGIAKIVSYGVTRYAPVTSFNFSYSDKIEDLRIALKRFRKNSRKRTTTP